MWVNIKKLVTSTLKNKWLPPLGSWQIPFLGTPYSPLGPRLTFPFSRYSSSSMLMWFQNEFKPPIYHPLAAAHQCFCKENASYTLWLLSFLCHLGNKKAFIEVDFIICTFFPCAIFTTFFFIWMSQEIWIKKGGFGAFNKIADGVLQSDERDSEVALWYVFSIL